MPIFRINILDWLIKYLGTKNHIEVLAVGKVSAKFFREGDIIRTLGNYSLIRIIHKDKVYISEFNWFGRLIYKLKLLL